MCDDRLGELSLKHEANLTITKPSAAEKLQILQSLDDNAEVINRVPHPDHDYEGDRQCHVVNFERSNPIGSSSLIKENRHEYTGN